MVKKWKVQGKNSSGQHFIRHISTFKEQNSLHNNEVEECGTENQHQLI